jgi:membrane associated rhomboid family serine protease
VSALAVLLYAGRYLERAWSSKEYVKFIAVCTIVPNLLAFGAGVLIYYIFGSASFMYILFVSG